MPLSWTGGDEIYLLDGVGEMDGGYWGGRGYSAWNRRVLLLMAELVQRLTCRSGNYGVRVSSRITLILSSSKCWACRVPSSLWEMSKPGRYICLPLGRALIPLCILLKTLRRSAIQVPSFEGEALVFKLRPVYCKSQYLFMRLVERIFFVFIDGTLKIFNFLPSMQ